MKTFFFFLFLLSCVCTQLQAQQVLDTRILASDVENLSEMAWGSDGWLWFTSHPGSVSRVHPGTGELQEVLTVPEVAHPGMNGLQGMALSGSGSDVQVFLLDIYDADPDDAVIKNHTRIVRYDFDGTSFASPVVIMDRQLIWNFEADLGLRIVDDKLFVLSGSNTAFSDAAQLPSDPDGKILRMNLDGTVPEGNPFYDLPYPGNLVWSLGHGLHHDLVAGSNGVLYSTDGDWAENTELNIIEKEGNYGWPHVLGFCDLPDEVLFCQEHEVAEPIFVREAPMEVSGVEFYDGDVLPDWKRSLLISARSKWGLRQIQFSEDGRMVTGENIIRDYRLETLRDICFSPDGRVFVAVDSSQIDGYSRTIVEIRPWEKSVPAIDGFELSDDAHCGQTDALISFATTGSFEEDNEFLVVTVDPDNPADIRELIDRVSATSGGTYRIAVPALSEKASLQIISTHPYMRGPVSEPIDFFTPPEIRIQGDTLICDEEGTWLSVNMIPDAEIRWSTGATEPRIYVQDSGVYSVQLTWPNGCASVREEIRISKGARPDLTISTDERDLVLCKGDSLLLIARVTGDATVEWSGGYPGLDSLWVTRGGDYIASAYDNVGCTTVSDTVTVTVYPFPEKPEVVRSNNILVCSPAATYQWYRDGEPVDGGTEQLLTVTDNGRYWVEVFNSGGCSAVSDTVEMIVTGVGEEAVAGDDWQVYPQPVEDQMMLEFAAPVREPLVVSLTDMSGREVRRFRESPDGTKQKMFSLSDLPSGPYILSVKSGTRTREQVIIKR